MVDLFRFIQHEFAVPAHSDVIELANESDFQQALDAAAAGEDPAAAGQEVRSLASTFLDDTITSPTLDPASAGSALASWQQTVLRLESVTSAKVASAVESHFGAPAATLASSDAFAADLELLQNIAVAVKLVTGFDRLDTSRLADQLRAAAFVRHLADDDPPGLDRAKVAHLLARPLQVPAHLLAVLRMTPPPIPEPENAPTPEAEAPVDALRQERDALQAAEDLMLRLRPEELDVIEQDRGPEVDESMFEQERGVIGVPGEAAVSFSALRVSGEALARFSGLELEAVRELGIDVADAPLVTSLDRVGERLENLNKHLLPMEVATSVRVQQVGAHLVAQPPRPLITTPPEPPAAPLHKPVIRPVGYGNLQVVRQRLRGYEAGEVSHIENVLPHETFTRSTERTELWETVQTDEDIRTQHAERDQQTTDRSELASQTQREAGNQTNTSGPGMSSSEYGKLVENKKSNYAQEVVSRSMAAITQQVRSQRVARESRTFVERVEHSLENPGAEPMSGVYQWVDKRYDVRVLNRGRRLLYDVVVPEPAALLTQALTDSVQPESFQLVKPLPPDVDPASLSRSNYQWYAARYGVTDSVSPPPAVFDRTVNFVTSLAGSVGVDAYAASFDLAQQGVTSIRVPEGYKAVRGYVQRVNGAFSGQHPERWLEVFVGENHFQRFSTGDGLNRSFRMSGETGDVPVTYRTFEPGIYVSFAIGVICQRTDEAFAAWQLRTHATIVAGYQRQLAEYEDRLARYVAAARARLAAAGGYSHDPGLVTDELKRAVVFLLLGEQPTSLLPTPVPAPTPSSPGLPDPVAVTDWGAMVAFFERAFEWENLMHACYPYFWARRQRWSEMVLVQDADPQFEEFLKAGAARVVVPVRPGFEGAVVHFQETGEVWMGEEVPDMFGANYVSIIKEVKGADLAPADEVLVAEWSVVLPTTLVVLRTDSSLPTWPATPTEPEP